MLIVVETYLLNAAMLFSSALEAVLYTYLRRVHVVNSSFKTPCTNPNNGNSKYEIFKKKSCVFG